MKLPIAPAAACLCGSLVCAFAAPASALPGSSRCIANGDIVTLEGVASTGRDARDQAWVLHLERPACVVRRSRHEPLEKIFAIRIIGTPPPLNIPLQLTGKLLLGSTSPGPTMFAALAVISGRKETTADSRTPPRTSSPPAMPSGLPSRTTAARCGSPPYGGTPTEYEAFVRRFGEIIKPQKILAGICNAKFGQASRDGLHRLGITDTQISSESTERLAANTIVALKTLVNTIE